jgi:hypothetical protein
MKELPSRGSALQSFGTDARTVTKEARIAITEAPFETDIGSGRKN